MYQTFNMGVGMEIVVETEECAKKVIQHANKYGINAYMVGHTEKSADGVNRVAIGSQLYTK